MPAQEQYILKDGPTTLADILATYNNKNFGRQVKKLISYFPCIKIFCVAAMLCFISPYIASS
jgi:hypothetical protein